MKRLLIAAVTIATGALTMTSLATTPSSAAPRAAGTGVSALARPSFQMPFPCAQKWRIDTWSRSHNPAVDMVREPQRQTEGSPAVASAAGVVVRSNYRPQGAGNVIQIRHSGRWYTTYIHLQSRSVRVGQRVALGQLIGKVGHTGATSHGTPHLHYEQAYDRNNDGRAEWGHPNNERQPVVFNGRTYSGAGRTWRNVVSRNKCGTPTNPYTPTQVCGPGYRVIDSQALTGGRVYLLWKSGGTNCVVTLKSTNLGRPSPMSAYLRVGARPPVIDRGNYAYYAGPVRASANRICIRWGGSIGRSSYISPPEHCG